MNIIECSSFSTFFLQSHKYDQIGKNFLFFETPENLNSASSPIEWSVNPYQNLICTIRLYQISQK
ncbi:hypothetical protein BWD12_09965 [Leptospira santarosai serovar Bananal]|nr:hypothetical protein BWD11_12505 [Leptospira santarosai serovar Grippotyphosa]ONF79039.1 hypothetical protein BWD12_09965 [Leptospira santarosai serovar Bananal]